MLVISHVFYSAKSHPFAIGCIAASAIDEALIRVKSMNVVLVITNNEPLSKALFSVVEGCQKPAQLKTKRVSSSLRKKFESPTSPSEISKFLAMTDPAVSNTTALSQQGDDRSIVSESYEGPPCTFFLKKFWRSRSHLNYFVKFHVPQN